MGILDCLELLPTYSVIRENHSQVLWLRISVNCQEAKNIILPCSNQWASRAYESDSNLSDLQAG